MKFLFSVGREIAAGVVIACDLFSALALFCTHAMAGKTVTSSLI